MRVAFLISTVHDLGGTAGAVVTQANALAAAGHEVQVLSVYRHSEEHHFAVDDRVLVRDLVDLREGVRVVGDHGLDGDRLAALRDVEATLIPPGTDPTVDALTDLALEAVLPTLDVDVLVSVTPAMLAYAVALAPPRVAVVHQEHRSSSARPLSRDLLLDRCRRADVVAMLTEPMATWLRDQLGPQAPEVVVVPNAVPSGFRPRSLLTEPVIVGAGRLAVEKQWTSLISAFATVADRMPGWRLRVFGEGHARFDAVGLTRKLGLFDRVELPGPTDDLASEWARASIAALTSQPGEGFPLVIQEAMAAGVPVVAYDMPSGPRDQIDDGVDGLLVAQGSEAGLAAALLRLASDDAERRRIGAAAHARTAAWSSTAVTARWEQVLADAVARHAAAPSRALLRPAALATPSPAASGTTSAAGVTPVQARVTALRLAVAAAARTGARWWVEPPRAGRPPVVALPMAARRAFLRALAAADVPGWLSLLDPERRGWPARRGRPADLLEPLLRGRAGLVVIEPWPPTVDGEPTAVGRDCGVEVRFWEEGPDGDLHATARPTYTARVPADVELVTASVLGLDVPVLALSLDPSPTELAAEVDVVYTWVDGSDPAWQAARASRLAASDDPVMRSRASSGASRYTDRGELRASLRTVHLHAPWVRRIHLVTAGQAPPWLDVDHPQINLVDHRDIMPAAALPTFNSHAIEASLHHIDGLAEHFVYLNDDVLLGRPVAPERFFGPGGSIAVDFSPLTIGLPDQADRPYLQAAGNNRRLLHQAFGATTLNLLSHTPFAHRVSLLREVVDRFPAEVAATVASPFRASTDVSLLSSLAQHYALLTGRAFVTDLDIVYVDITEAVVRRRLRALLDHERTGVCLGESHVFAREETLVNRLVADFLEAYAPVAAPWER